MPVHKAWRNHDQCQTRHGTLSAVEAWWCTDINMLLGSSMPAAAGAKCLDWELFQISWLVLETSKMFHFYSDANGSLFRLWHRLWHVMLDVILITCLVVIAVAWLVLNNWECLMCHERITFVSIKHKIVVFSFDALFGLTWHMLISCYDFKPVTLSLYDHLVFDL